MIPLAGHDADQWWHQRATAASLLSHWTTEVVPGIFVGIVSARFRDQLWDAVTDVMGEGAAVLIHCQWNRATPYEPHEPSTVFR
ncbi:type I-E CRISPR-associated endoribonuclease Cas2 [Streptomyces sp. cg2]|uniref:type I-E CRISPR-associated endoribonuclease Cas2 n=1 Tax=Streptomyces sp. cg2 TaxID=3238799 RepID=UPI0034E2B55D